VTKKLDPLPPKKSLIAIFLLLFYQEIPNSQKKESKWNQVPRRTQTHGTASWKIMEFLLSRLVLKGLLHKHHVRKLCCERKEVAHRCNGYDWFIAERCLLLHIAKKKSGPR
jgi:hypothetical protein